MSETGGALNVQELIRKKRDGEQLDAHDIRAFIRGVTSATIQESQIGAMLMAIWQKGMVAEETTALTKEMMMSGNIFHWPQEWARLVVDKHSTGGVGDKVSLPLAPALAACGCKVPMISGRGLAHTGGTLDKLESIPGFNIQQSVDQIRQILKDVGCCIVGQTENLVPADRILYALRDATATVDSVPLITGSIIAKKGAEGLCALVLDVKYGRAALYKDFNSARNLAQSLITMGNSLGMKTGAVLTRMDTPIGRCIGNTLEVFEALECLKGRATDDLKELVTSLGGYLLWMSGRSPTLQTGQEEISRVLTNGEALHKFQAMLEAQGVSKDTAQALCSENIDYFNLIPRAEYQTEFEALDNGTVLDIDGLLIATVLHQLGAGRTKAGESINYRVGAELLVDLGQQISKGQSWIRIHHDCPKLSPQQHSDLQGTLVIGSGESYQAKARVTEFMPPPSL
ncbi:thymidine phosphorylase [Electrophorus electricus]|uniref:thymidine phosphorylase n=1 Tax=Electrophorus electricus TaxID=8005 RepID=UPI0015D05A6C|nr:thymidine phosphorylase [Electrophorus electricus]